jgi:hypothetical protein
MKMPPVLTWLLVCGIAQAANWRSIGTTETHHDAADIVPCAGLSDESRAKILQAGGSDACEPFHMNAYTETRRYLVDTDSIHREGPYIYHWEQADISTDLKNWSKESRSLIVTDCEEQKRKMPEYVQYRVPIAAELQSAGGLQDKIINHFVYGKGYCDRDPFHAGDVVPCWPHAWGEPTWDRVIPDSIGEAELHFVCTYTKTSAPTHQ